MVRKGYIYCNNVKYKLCTLLALFLILLLSVIPFKNIPYQNEETQLNPFDNIKEASNDPNGKSLLIHQYANITNVFTNIESNENVSFTLYDDWVSQNTTINYEGVAQKRNIVNNSAFDSDDSDWVFKSNLPGSNLWQIDWQDSEGFPEADGCTGFKGNNENRDIGDYGYIEQNITLDNEVIHNDLAIFSFNYWTEWAPDFNASLFMVVIVGDLEINHSIYTPDITPGVWNTLSMTYNPYVYGQVLPGVVTIRVGLIWNENLKSWVNYLYLDNIECELWTQPNEEGIIKSYDTQIPQNYTYYNTTFGEGFSFIDIERPPDSDYQIEFTIYSNSSGLSEFYIEKITIMAHAIKKYNSTVSNKIGSLYTLGESITWYTEFSVSIPTDYSSWIDLEKPADWSFFNIIDGFDNNKTLNCKGRDFGSRWLKINKSVLGEGLWKFDAISKNYLSQGNIAIWNGTQFENKSLITFGDIFQVNITFNDSISLSNTEINYTMYYPNNTIFREESKEPAAYNIKFWNFTVGKNMTVGEYSVNIEWTNNQSYISREKVGFIELKFTVWHHTNLSTETPYFERIIGDPLLLKVNLTDSDIDKYVSNALILYNSTFGTAGTLFYQGLGIYYIEIETNSLALGDYYFSFNTSKTFYENITEKDFIRLKIIAQPLALQLPRTIINSSANSYISCQINVTGAISGTFITDDANITTDWDRSYTVKEYDNGTYTLNFSTSDLPTQGTVETFTVTVYANKTHYGSTSDVFTIQVQPIQTVIYVDKSVINTYINDNFNIFVNFFEKESNKAINGATCSVEWAGSYSVESLDDGFLISFNTNGLLANVYNPLIKLEKVGYETKYKTITTTVSEQPVELTVFVNSIQINESSQVEFTFDTEYNLSVQVFSIRKAQYLSGSNITCISEKFTQKISESEGAWYNTSLTCSFEVFSLGLNYIYINFQKDIYQNTTFSFQVLVQQVEIEVIPLNFDEFEEYFVGDNITIQLSLRDPSNDELIEGATVSYSWEYGLGSLIETENGTYELNLAVPANLRGNHKITLIISKEGMVYKPVEFSFVIGIRDRELPNYILFIIIAIILFFTAILAALSVRAYILIPRRRRIESELLARTQGFKDIENIQAVIVIQKHSGLPICIKSYSTLGGDNKDLFAGFIQAIIGISQEFEPTHDPNLEIRDVEKTHIVEKLIELDFKYFYCLIGDREKVRVVLFLKEKASERLKGNLSEFLGALTYEFGDKFDKWMGDLDQYQEPIYILINEYFKLYYKDKFKLNNPIFIAKNRKARVLSSMEIQVLNIIYSMSKGKRAFKFDEIFNITNAENKDLVIEAIEGLIERNIIIPDIVLDDLESLLV